MNVTGKVVVVAGGGGGLGRAVATRFAADDALLVVADIDGPAVHAVASDLGAVAIEADLGREAGVLSAIDAARQHHGRVDLYCAIAAFRDQGALVDLSDDDWDASWRVNTMSHVWAARALLPEMLARGEGYFFFTLSTAALTLAENMPMYSATKRAALAFGEFLAVQYGGRGIKVSCFCPRGMRSEFFLELSKHKPESARAIASAINLDEAADIVSRSIEAEQFLVLTEDEEYASHQAKAADYDTWIARQRAFVAGERAGETTKVGP
jgi:NAD(P)-dependent dehydrogenase (short-subunit alcohol dehydrogenase family)